MENKLIFVSIPYSNPDEDVQMDRYLTSMSYVAKLMNEGLFAYSPIASGIEIAKRHNLPTDWGYWSEYCNVFISRCEEMHVIMMDGWEDSEGVKGEIEKAIELKKHIKYVPVDESFLVIYNSYKRMKNKINDFFLSEEGQKSIDKFSDKLVRNNELHNYQIKRFHKYFGDKISVCIEKYITKYNSREYIDLCYHKGYEPNNEMFFFLNDYAKIYGRKANDEEWSKYGNEFTSSLLYLDGYYFIVMHGQGSVINVLKQK